MDDDRLLIDLHSGAARLGPGGDAETERAVDLAGLDRSAPLKIADIGCGTGASTLLLARLLSARITAVDLMPEFLRTLEDRAADLGLSSRIATLACAMDDLPFEAEEFDVIWSEGAIYNMGFAKGVEEWNRYLKVGGLLVVSELIWRTSTRPAELQAFWDGEYPGIGPASAKIRTLEESGYSPVGHFVLPEHCWLENYYRPLQDRFAEFLQRNGNSEEARAIVAAEKREIEFFEKYNRYYGYGVFVARKTGRDSTG
jgi:SAM-dependent methyltransferase